MEYLSSDKLNQLGIQCGLWERLMAVCDVENACIALIDEDQQEAVHRFLDQYSKMLMDYIFRMRQDGYTHAEIAQKLGYKTSSAVTKRIDKLRVRWDEFTDEHEQRYRV